jgi:hypothetical protein
VQGLDHSCNREILSIERQALSTLDTSVKEYASLVREDIQGQSGQRIVKKQKSGAATGPRWTTKGAKTMLPVEQCLNELVCHHHLFE